MAITYPTSLDTFPNPTGSTAMTGHAAAHVDIGDAIEAIEAKLGLNPSGPTVTTGAGSIDALVRRVFHPESYGAIPENAYSDGKMAWGGSSATSKTLTSAAATFTAGDVGKSIVVYRANVSSNQALYTTIASFTNANTVVLTAGQGRGFGLTQLFFSYGDDQTAAFQAALDAAGDAGGGTVEIGPGSWLVGTLTVRDQSALVGMGRRVSILRAKPSLNAPVVRNDPGAVTTVGTTASGGATALIVTSATGFVTTKPVTIRLDTGDYFTSNVSSIVSNTINLSTALPSTVTAGGSAYVSQRIAVLTYLADFTIVGCKGQQSSGSAHGIYLSGSNTGAIGQPMDTLLPEKQHYVRGVYILETKDDGYHCDHGSSAAIADCFVYYNDGVGYYGSYDHKFVNCETGHAGEQGWYIANSSVRCVGCKAWFSGNITSSLGHGFHVDGISTGGTVALVGCEAQDNKANGFFLNSSAGVVLSGCVADTNNNSTGTGTSTSATLYAGYTLTGSSDCVIESCSSVDRFGTVAQASALLMTGTSLRNRISITHRSPNVAIGAIVHGSSTSIEGNAIAINNQEGVLSIAYAATITPNPYNGGIMKIGALTGNMTINAPTGSHTGMEIIFLFVQDATGGRALTWNAAYLTTFQPDTRASSRSVVAFVFDGTSWLQTGYDGLDRAELVASWDTDRVFTNVGATYVDVYAAVTVRANSFRRLVNFAGFSQFRILGWWNQVAGAGVTSLQIVESGTPSNILGVATATTGTGEREADSGWTTLPAWATGERLVIPQMKSTTANDDPTFHSCSIQLR